MTETKPQHRRTRSGQSSMADSEDDRNSDVYCDEHGPTTETVLHNANSGGTGRLSSVHVENFLSEMEQQHPEQNSPYKKPPARWMIIAVISTLAVLAVLVGALVPILGGGSNSDNTGSNESSLQSNNARDNRGQTRRTSVPVPPPVTEAAAPPAPAHTAPPVSVPVVPESNTPVTIPQPLPAPAPEPEEEPTTEVPTSSPTTELFAYLKSNMADWGISLHIPDSYQYKAFQWVETTLNVDRPHDLQHVLQRFVLACIYFSTNQQESMYTEIQLGMGGVTFGWKNQDGWSTALNNPGVVTDADNECGWYGITCDENEYVTEIDLSDNDLTGSMPNEMDMLANTLTRLLLEKNEYLYNSGNSQLFWIGRLTKLRELDISDTAFHSSLGIPTQVFHSLANLEILDVAYTLFSGPINTTNHRLLFWKLGKLQFLDIGGNRWESGLSSGLARSSQLRYFYAEQCDLQGDLSVWRDLATSTDFESPLSELWIDLNSQVTGEIPAEMGLFSELETLSLSNLGLTGNIPPQLGNCAKLKQLWLYGNQLDGSIPPHLGNLTQLVRLEVEANNLVGDMPDAICQNVGPQQLQVVEADCDANNTEVNCPSTCCSCCGEQCASNAPKEVTIPDDIIVNRNRLLRRETTTRTTSEKAMSSPEDRRMQERITIAHARFQDPLLRRKANERRQHTRKILTVLDEILPPEEEPDLSLLLQQP